MVIVKSTQQYNGGEYVEYGMLDILQMIGRAGRPQVSEDDIYSESNELPFSELSIPFLV